MTFLSSVKSPFLQLQKLALTVPCICSHAGQAMWLGKPDRLLPEVAYWPSSFAMAKWKSHCVAQLALSTMPKKSKRSKRKLIQNISEWTLQHFATTELQRSSDSTNKIERCLNLSESSGNNVRGDRARPGATTGGLKPSSDLLVLQFVGAQTLQIESSLCTLNTFNTHSYT